ncbi:MAG: ATP synthase F1 subunit delta [Phycisphaerae bacterium]|nr:ATP synthase F1 subunit delta [Phycisphaerae bacterium]
MATDFDISHAAGAIYAESLLQLANEANEAEEIGEELRELKALWNRDVQFATMMSSAAIDVGARRASIRKAFGSGRVSRLVLNLLLVMNDKRRSMILPAVCDAYRRKLDRQLGREEVRVTTAVPLDDKQRIKLRAEIKRLTGNESDLVERVDPDVVAGMTVQVADRLYDMSASRRLRDLRAALLASVEKHLLGGVSRFVTEA